MKVKNPTCFNKACSKNCFKCSKKCYFAHFSLENSNSRAITYALTKLQAPVAIIIYSVTKMKFRRTSYAPIPCTVFKLLHHEPFYNVFGLLPGSKPVLESFSDIQCVFLEESRRHCIFL